MSRPKPEHETVQVLLRLHPEVIAVIDKLRGDLSRAAWITACVGRDLGDRAARASELKLAKREAAVEGVSVLAGLQFGPVRRKRGEGLKER
ncbi:MAG: hypothetical protein KGL39_48385 [Patescibacteria group bacterium]|nr:hypothetical protein [Patescibacteria group bacterium]